MDVTDQTQSLFDPLAYRELRGIDPIPYSLLVEHLAKLERTGDLKDEAVIMSDALSHDLQYLEPRGLVAGPLRIQIGNDPVRDLASGGTPFAIPAWIEADGLTFRSAHAQGVLLIDNFCVFQQLFEARAWVPLNLILATSLGVPRAELRRFLRRLSIELSVPVYLFTDNDTWGYFNYSVLKRGFIAPHTNCPHLGIEEMFYLGLRSKDAMRIIDEGLIQSRPWKSIWDKRLAALRKYECFCEPAWQDEFDAYEQRRQASSLGAVMSAVGIEGVLRFIAERICENDVLPHPK